MLTSTIEIFCRLLLLIKLIAGTSLYYKTHNQVRIIIQTFLQEIKSRTTELKYQLLIEQKYLSSITRLWKDLNKLLDRTSELDSVLFNKVFTKFRKLCERKALLLYSKRPVLEKNGQSN